MKIEGVRVQPVIGNLSQRQIEPQAKTALKIVQEGKDRQAESQKTTFNLIKSQRENS